MKTSTASHLTLARGLAGASAAAVVAFVGLSFAQETKPAAKPTVAAAKAPAPAPAGAKQAAPASPASVEQKYKTNVKGPADAPIKVVEFADFMCPACQSASNALRAYFNQQGPDINLTFKNFPLEQSCNPGIGRTIHNGACELALGAICASDLGQFWPYHDRIFSRSWEVATRQDVVEHGVAVGMNKAKLEACLASPEAKSKLALQVKEGFEAVVNQTPTLLVNGRKLSAINLFRDVVEEERKKLAAPPAAK